MTSCVKGKRDLYSLEEPPEKNCMNWALPGVKLRQGDMEGDPGEGTVRMTVRRGQSTNIHTVTINQ